MNTYHTKKAIIVGATSGIGLEVAKLLTNGGWQIGIAGRRVELLQQITENLPNVKTYREIDVTEDTAVRTLHEMIDELGGMDLYFHSSGIGFQNVEFDTDKEDSTVQTNAVGFTRMVGAAFDYFKKNPNRNGHIAAISSIAGTKGLGAAPAYSATKRFQSTYLECLEQLARMEEHNIRITDIRPGFVATALLKDGGSYPLQLNAESVAKEIVSAIERKESVRIIDWKYRLLVFFWRMIPRCIWVRLKIKTK